MAGFAFPFALAGGVDGRDKIFFQGEEQEKGVLRDGGVVDAGGEKDGIPNSVAVFTSILSTPMPYLLMIRSRGRAFSRTGRVMASSPQMKASISPTRARICVSFSGPRARTISHPASARIW
jgi:hypothetical protein